ncbi:MAG: hypothetical protein LBR80_02285 [Deltaproteobacteria bacterium]|nr:hypothetical protein [Deltaproteobacteria bacterium]
MERDSLKAAAAERAFWETTLKVTHECLELDRRFAGTVKARHESGDDPLDPELWENFIEARRSLVDFTAQSLNLIARDRAARERNREAEERLKTALGEMVRLEEGLAGFLTVNLKALKDTVEHLSRNQAIFTGYARASGAKPGPETLETRA